MTAEELATRVEMYSFGMSNTGKEAVLREIKQFAHDTIHACAAAVEREGCHSGESKHYTTDYLDGIRVAFRAVLNVEGPHAK